MKFTAPESGFAEQCRDELRQVASDIAVAEAFLDRHQETVDELGLEPLSFRGADRLVFRTPEQTVIKIARSETHCNVNYSEQAVWSLYGDTGFFAPVIETGSHHAWLEMVYCESVSDDEAREFIKRVEDSPISIIDLHTGNVGRYEGTLVAYDYPNIHDPEHAGVVG
jgi:hypothetical protein